MEFVFSKYKNMMIDFIRKEKLFLFLITITSVASYGFTLINFSIGLDDTSADRYIRGGESLAQGRFGGALLDKLFGVMEFIPFWVDFLAVLTLVFAAIIWSILFRSVSNGKIKSGALIIFATIFISYPIISEIFIYMPASLSICIGYLLTGIALTLSYEFVRNSKKISLGVTSILLMCFAVSLYESFAAVYICGFFAVLVIKHIFKEEPRGETVEERLRGEAGAHGECKDSIERASHLDLKNYLWYIVKFCIILLIAIILDLIISNILIISLDLTRSTNGENSIFWLNEGSKLEIMRNLFTGLKENFIYAAMLYKPIFTFLVACILTAVLAIVFAIKTKSITPIILMAGLLLSNISLSIVQGAASPYRTCQSFAIFIGFIFMLLAILSDGSLIKDSLTKDSLTEDSLTEDSFINGSLANSRYRRVILKVILYVLVFLLVLSQTKDLTKGFYNDYRRFEMDKSNIIHIAQSIEENYGRNVQKPVVFVGDPGNYDTYHKNQTNGLSFLRWSIGAFYENSTELLKFMKIYGFNFVQATSEQALDVKVKAKDMPAWPMKGYIAEFDDCIVVNFG